MFQKFISNQGRLVSFERLISLAIVTQEAEARSLEFDPPEIEWPALPTIAFQNYSLRYRPDTPPVLKNLNFEIKAGEKVSLTERVSWEWLGEQERKRAQFAWHC